MGNEINTPGLERLRSMGHTQTRIAHALGFSVAHISRIAQGRFPEPECIMAVAELLEKLPPKDWPDRWLA